MHKIVLFKNKKLKKVFSTYKEYNRCNTKFKELLKDNKSVEFYIDHANGNDINKTSNNLSYRCVGNTALNNNSL